MKHPDLDRALVTSTWTAFQKSVGGLAPIRNEKDYLFNGRRNINARQPAALAKRFNVSSAAFIA